MRDTSLASSAAIQLRVIYALVMREVITRYGRSNIGFMWQFVHPMLFTACIAFVWSLTKGNLVSSVPVVAFALTGYSATLLWRQTSARCLKALESNTGLLWHRNVTPFDVYLARIVLEIAGNTVSFYTLTVIFCLLGKISPPASTMKVLAGWFVLSFFTASLALLVGIISDRTKIFTRLWSMFTYFLFPFSGAAVMVDWAPPKFQKILLSVPMVHGIEMIREGYFGTGIHAHYSITYISLFSSTLLLIALLLSKTQRNRLNTE